MLLQEATEDPAGAEENRFQTLHREEELRGERFAWNFHWLLYGLILAFVLVVHFYQRSPVGTWGMVIVCFPLALNGFASRAILQRRPAPWLRYAYAVVDITCLTTYNALDTFFNSTLTPVTTATLLVYPIALFLASLQLDRRLIVFSTLYTVISMNVLFAVAYPRFDPDIVPKLVCANVECQVYRTGYILLFGGLLFIFPATLTRLLQRQKVLFEQNLKQYALAHIDSLTGLANRLLFQKFLGKILPLARRHGHRFALLYLDLDGFKKINDTQGHLAGDKVLREVACRLQAVVRESDLAARLGGDEFALVVQHIDGRDGAEILAGRILSSLHRPIEFGEEPLHIGASIGIALFPDDAGDADQLLRLADEALYRVKRNGKDGSAFI